MSIFAAIACAAWALAASFLGWYLAGLASEVAYVTLADGTRKARSIPLAVKVILPFATNFRSLLSKERFAAKRAEYDGKLVAAGYEGLISGIDFMALKILAPTVLGTCWAAVVFLLSSLASDTILLDLRIPLIMLGYVLFFFYCDLWLSSALKKRHAEIAKDLPFVLDILTLCVEAGLDFISAMQRSLKSRKMTALNEELLRMTKEIQLGVSRKDALRRLAERTRHGDLRLVAFALIQADELGAGIGNILRIQSEQMRAKRFDRAEKSASLAPTKMLFPLMLFIFPAVFIILLGPVLLKAFTTL